jgi:hypothetical protein
MGGDEWEPVLFDEEEPEDAVRVRIKVRHILAFPISLLLPEQRY